MKQRISKGRKCIGLEMDNNRQILAHKSIQKTQPALQNVNVIQNSDGNKFDVSVMYSIVMIIGDSLTATS